MKNDEQNYDLCTERNVTSIEKLAFIGKRGMGALEFLRPVGSKPAELERVPKIKRGSLTGQIDIKALADLAEKIAMERENRLSSESHNITRDDAVQFARDNGIRRPDAIIGHLKAWGEWKEDE